SPHEGRTEPTHWLPPWMDPGDVRRRAAMGAQRCAPLDKPESMVLLAVGSRIGKPAAPEVVASRPSAVDRGAHPRSAGPGDALDYFSHGHARSRAYRWGEDGLAVISDDQQLLCFAIALWNGEDPILKERLFGLTNREGNHGEDVKKY